MKKAALLAAGIFFALTAAAQQHQSVIAGNGKIVTEKRQISDFSKVKVWGAFEVCLTKGKTGEITIEGDQNVLAIVKTEVDKGTLTIGTVDQQPVKASIGNKIKIKLPYQYVDYLTLTGCGSINVRGMVRAAKFRAIVDGPGNIDVAVISENAEAWIMGSGSIEMAGSSSALSCRIVGAGTIKAQEMEADAVTVNISGSGDAKVNSKKALTGRIAGTGNVAFLGEPKELDLRRLGEGSFSRD